MNIHQKISDIMKEVQYISKDDNVSFGQTKYKALSEEKMTDIMRRKLVEHGLVVYPIEMSESRNGNITHVSVKYRMVNVDDTTDYIDIVSCGDGADTQDKGSGKAMTYAFKYMWLRTFAIPTGEDPDKICSEQLDAEMKEASESKNVWEGVGVSCEKCGEIIKNYNRKNGEIIYANDIIRGSIAKYNKKLCYQCCKKEQKLNELVDKVGKIFENGE